ncbi:MAG: HD domain-containing phosphohydrolase [Bacillota bacterium]
MQRKWGTMTKILAWMLFMGIMIGLIFPFVIAKVIHIHSPAKLLLFIAASLAAGGFVGYLNYTIVKNSLVKPLTEIINTTQNIASGNYNSVCLTVNNKHDLISRLSNAINKMVSAINDSHNQLLLMSKTDGLTQVLNRRTADLILLELNKEKANNVFVILVDLDKFKMFNDLYGHQVGDSILKSVAQALVDNNNEYILTRYGGDEFLAIFKNSTREIVQQVIEGWLEKINTVFIERNEQKIPVTLSIGVAVYPDDTENILSLPILADKAMYNVKYKGGNGYVFYSESSEFTNLSSSTYKSLEGLIFALDSRDKYTKCHSDQVAKLALAIYREMNIDELSEEIIMIAGLLHDVGKVGLPNDILNKPGRLTDEEYDLVKKHPVIGKQIIELMFEKNSEEIINGVLYHHERFDGKGYPEGLKGKDIPLIARILGIADAFSAMFQDRVYRKGLNLEEIVLELEKNSGKQFDPEISKILVQIIKTKPELIKF